MMKHSWWEWSLREKIIPPSTGPKESLMTCENNNNNVSHKLWPLQSPDYNPIWHLWETLDQHIESTLHHHHTNAKSGNLMDLQMWRFVDSVSSQYMFRVFWVVAFFGGGFTFSTGLYSLLSISVCYLVLSRCSGLVDIAKNCIMRTEELQAR